MRFNPNTIKDCIYFLFIVSTSSCVSIKSFSATKHTHFTFFLFGRHFSLTKGYHSTFNSMLNDEDVHTLFFYRLQWFLWASQTFVVVVLLSMKKIEEETIIHSVWMISWYHLNFFGFSFRFAINLQWDASIIAMTGDKVHHQVCAVSLFFKIG